MKNNSRKRYSGLAGRMGNSHGTANFENLKEKERLKEKNKEWEVAIPEWVAESLIMKLKNNNTISNYFLCNKHTHTHTHINYRRESSLGIWFFRILYLLQSRRSSPWLFLFKLFGDEGTAVHE